MALRPALAAILVALASTCNRSDPGAITPAGPAASGAAAAAAPSSAAIAPLAPLPPEAFPEGPCGGFEQAKPGKRVELLGGRLSIETVEGLEPLGRPHDVMGAPWSAELETRAYLERDGKKLVVLTEELLARPGADLAAAIRKEDDEAADAYLGTLAAGTLRAVAVVPLHPKPDDEKALALGLYVTTPDDMLVRVRFFVSPDVLLQGAGCSALARRMAATLVAGTRKLDLSGGTRELSDGLAIDLPPGLVLVPQPGPDFTLYYAYPIVGLGQEGGGLGLYIGGWPKKLGEGTRVPGKLLGAAVDWIDRQEEKTHRREARAEIPGSEGTYVHVFFNAPEATTFALFEKAAASVRKKP